MKIINGKLYDDNCDVCELCGLHRSMCECYLDYQEPDED